VFGVLPPDAGADGADVAAGAEVAGAEVAAGADVAAGDVVGGAVTVTVEFAAQPAVSAVMASAGRARSLRLAPVDELFNLASLVTEETFSQKYRAAHVGPGSAMRKHPTRNKVPTGLRQ
jgi:hypothetical protein